MCANFSFGAQADCQIPPRRRLEWQREDELRAEAQGHGAVECAVLSAERDQRQRYSRSRACKLRGGPKISRRMIASRKPDFDASKIAMSVFKSAPLGTARVAAA